MIDKGIDHTDSENALPGAIDQKFKAAVAEVEDYGIFLLDLTGKILSWNSGADRINGYAAKDIVGKSFKLFYTQEDLAVDLPERLLTQAREKGKVTHEGWRIKKTGHRFWGSVTITALHDQEGNLTGYINVSKDLTDKKISEDRHNNMLADLQTKNEELRGEEERYRKMVSEVNDYAIIPLDTEGKILDWNKGAENIYGYTSAEMVGRNFRLFYPQEDKDKRLPETLLGEAAVKGFANHEGYGVKKDGTRFWARIATAALYDDDKKLIGFSKVTKDLTERKAAQDKLAVFSRELQLANEELRRSEERYHKMISEVQDYAILLLNVRGEVQNWNDGAKLIKGYDSHEIIGKSFHLFYFPDDLERGLPDQLLREARERGKAASEGWRRRKDGSRFWANVVITALHDDSGNVIGFSKVTRDLTENKAAEDAQKENTRQLELKNRELERLNSELTSFAYVTSHDFKEPIRKIQVFAHRQKEKDKSIEQIREFSDKIVSTAKRMQRLMESLLSYSRISDDDSVTDLVDLNEILAAVKVDLELPITESMAKIVAGTLPKIHGITFQLHQVFLNLISNAIKFAHPDRTPELRIHCTPVDRLNLPEGLLMNNREYVCLTFSDNGIGFTKEQSKKVFEVFKRLRPNDHHGTGIGLAIVKKVALNHGGCVMAEGTPDKGASFRIYLPTN